VPCDESLLLPWQYLIPHRLIEIHAVEQRRVITGQQLVGDDKNFWVLVALFEQEPDIRLALVGKLQLRDQRPVLSIVRLANDETTKREVRMQLESRPGRAR